MYWDYGNIVLFDGDDRFSRIIRAFNGQQYVHSGLLVERGLASQLNRRGEEVFIDLFDSNDHNNCIILTYKNITHEKREKLKSCYEDLIKTHSYDMIAILKLGFRHKMGWKPDMTNILRKGRIFCTSISSRAYEETMEHPVLEGVHYSQTEADHFLKSPYFEVIGEVRLNNFNLLLKEQI